MISVIVAGFRGKMGRQVVELINTSPGLKLVGGYDPKAVASDLYQTVYTDLANIPANAADVWVDFSTPTTVFENVVGALNKDMRPVIGTTGLTANEIEQLSALASEHQIGGLLVPNFSLSAVVMIMLAKQAVKFFPDVEIIELHNAKKVDAPSGTAKYTATQLENESPATSEVPIHSVRLPGYVAHQEVLFGGTGEALTIRQDSFDRTSFMPGVQLGIQKVMTSNEFVIGLENLI
ncbi:4-hydroxy-tetrahydrodipicolinate reductase [Periweissella cryptocerci]|uniref:4-hydroxy-tetrahydrodipicolinate reductase n=1 Tax=Periweissella cryptocerci TaxID=2506420 RepID=A0A4V1AIX8_9LACO|nr:dihydrodipicolinate reductase C-terminal domain-containing protein [Periweissella cryptocerci]QBO37055.1 4-hydroxy-tetrahydrodipicolinate reductase [Periweissella cryptocerci]